MNVNDIYAKDPETITPEERLALVEHYRAERIRFEALEKSGKRITKTAIAGTAKATVEAEDERLRGLAEAAERDAFAESANPLDQRVLD